jgi:hypothetical protein
MAMEAHIEKYAETMDHHSKNLARDWLLEKIAEDQKVLDDLVDAGLEEFTPLFRDSIAHRTRLLERIDK